MATFVCRVQFLDDTNPFNCTNFPEPTRPPLYTFREDIPLINQLAGVHRLLKAPHKVGPPPPTRYQIHVKCSNVKIFDSEAAISLSRGLNPTMILEFRLKVKGVRFSSI